MKENQFIPVKHWFDGLPDLPFIIAGPCSAESEKQVLDTARAIAATGRVKVFRSGIWKPRTRPNTFEGYGDEALRWLSQVKAQTGLFTITEVASPKHFEAVLKHGIDMVWIGARTTSNPFSVQELVEAMKGTNIPVFVKNPVTPDINLWIGAIERLLSSGIHKLAAVHRGFYPYEPTTLRNIPKWEVAIELKSHFHDLPVLCDVSHIAGDSKLIAEVAQEALNLNMNGLMIETHINPVAALSDANQQITPGALSDLLEHLVFKSDTTDNEEFLGQIEAFRRQIDSIDAQLIELLGQRLEIAHRIGVYKQKNNVTILQLRRWEKIMETRLRHGKKLGLSAGFVMKLLQLVHKESIRVQNLASGKKHYFDG